MESVVTFTASVFPSEDMGSKRSCLPVEGQLFAKGKSLFVCSSSFNCGCFCENSSNEAVILS